MHRLPVVQHLIVVNGRFGTKHRTAPVQTDSSAVSPLSVSGLSIQALKMILFE